MTGERAAEQWLTSRVDRACAASLCQLVDTLSQHLATAVGDAAAVRRLDPDGSLVALAAHHADPDRSEAMRAVMARTESAGSGLWAPVVRDQVTVRWSAQRADAQPSADQSAFIGDWSVRAVIGTPLVRDHRVLGGVALVRFGVAREFTDDEETLLLAFASRLARVIELLEVFSPHSGG